MNEEPVYESKKEIKETEETLFNNAPCGFMTCLFFGEVTSLDLMYDDSGLARLNLVISVKMPFKKFKSGYKFYKNRVTMWGREAEGLTRFIKERDEKKKENGTFIVIWSNRFGGEKFKENWSHTFSCFKYRIIENPNDFLKEIGESQEDSGVINIMNIMGL